MSNIVVIIQARVSSSRLPGKVLELLGGLPMFLYQIQRVAQCKKINNIVLATSDDVSDDSIVKICEDNQIDYFRGNLNDVLGRFYRAACYYKADIIVRLTADCPLSDPNLIDKMISFYLDHNYDYVSNGIKRTFPDGFDVEIFNFEILEKSYNVARLQSEREHVTPYIIKHPELFKLGSYVQQRDSSKYRVTVDYPEDLQLVRQIVSKLNKKFSYLEVISLLENNPSLVKLNESFECNEGYKQSVNNDFDYAAIPGIIKVGERSVI